MRLLGAFGAVGLIPPSQTAAGQGLLNNRPEPEQRKLTGRVEKRLVDSVFQSLASFETRDLGSGDVDRLASLRVATSARSALLDSESTETNQYHGVTSLQGAGDGFDHCIQRAASNSFWDISRCSDGIDQFRLVHSKSPYFC